MEESKGLDPPQTATSRKSQFVTELTENDVLLGRGQPILNYSGNVRFRQLIQSHKEAYTSTGKHSAKHEIASRILGAIEERGGRFLRKIEDQNERDILDISEDVMHAWLVVDDAVKMQKVKQALREQLSKSNDTKQTNPRQRKKARLSIDSEPVTGRSDHRSAATAGGGTVMQNQASQPPISQPIAGADPMPLFRLSQQPPADLLQNELLRSSTLIDRNRMLANLKQQQHLNPQMFLLLQQQQQQQRRQQEAMAVWQQQQQQQQQQQSQFQPSPILFEPDQRQQMTFGNPMTAALMPPNMSRWTRNAPLTAAAAAAGLDHSGPPNSLQNAVQRYLGSQQQQPYQPQALIAPLEPATLQADDSETSDEAEKPKQKKEESASSDSSSTELLREVADPG